MIFKQDNYKKINEKVKAFFQGPAWKKTLTFLFFLLLSFGFWFLQALQQPFEIEVTIPVQFKNIPSEIILDNETSPEITAKIRGKGTLLLKYTLWNKKNLALDVDLEDIDLKKTSYTISKRDLESRVSGYFSSTASLLSCNPDFLDITYQPIQKKELPVALFGELDPATGYALIDTALFTPSKVWVFGPEIRIDSLSAVYTKKISIKDIQGPIKKQIQLTVPEGVSLDKTSVELNVSAEEFTEKILQIPIICKNLPENYKIHIFPSSVEIIVPITLANYSKINESDFEISIDYRELLKNSDYITFVSLTKKPDSIENYRINPEEVEFLIEEKK